MRFWDSSAVVPLICQEKVSKQAVKLYDQDRQVLVWALTETEIISALCCRLREGALDRRDFRRSRHRLQLLSRDWMEIHALEQVKERAHRLLQIHPLRSADALQLASALIAMEDRPTDFEFVTYDVVLGTAAEKEGFHRLP